MPADKRTPEQKTVGDASIGVSSAAAYNAPISGAVGYAAQEDQPLQVHMEGEQCLLECGGTVTANNVFTR